MGSEDWGGFEVFTTCPPSNGIAPGEYLRRVKQVARWSDAEGCSGILVYTDNRLFDPWLISDAILNSTKELMPLVAVQPVYFHPFAVAKMVTTFANMYGRRICLNMVAGGFRNDLTALNDRLEHDDRYERLVEFTEIAMRLVEGATVSYAGIYYSVTDLSLNPPVPLELRPPVFISGSSAAGLSAASRLGATAVKYPRRTNEEERRANDGPRSGIRVGIIARSTSNEAWDVANRRFPVDRKGQIAHALAMIVSDSRWHQGLSELASGEDRRPHPYWLRPFKNYKTFCPYLVGGYDEVAEELARYFRLGFETLILDVPASREDLSHTRVALARTVELGRSDLRG